MNPQNNTQSNNPIPHGSQSPVPQAPNQAMTPPQANVPMSAPVANNTGNPTPVGAVNLVEEIIKALELQSLPADQQKEIIDKMTEIVLSRVSIRLTDQMTDEELDEFEKVVDEGGMEKGLHYLAQIFPNIPGIIQEELNTLQQEVKSDLSNMQSGPTPATPIPSNNYTGPAPVATGTTPPPLQPLQPLQPVQPNYNSTPIAMPPNMPVVPPASGNIQASPFLADEGDKDLSPDVESIIPEEE